MKIIQTHTATSEITQHHHMGKVFSLPDGKGARPASIAAAGFPAAIAGLLAAYGNPGVKGSHRLRTDIPDAMKLTAFHNPMSDLIAQEKARGNIIVD
jgi:hypothetical protein